MTADGSDSKRFLLATNGSPACLRAARELARMRPAHVVVVTVVPAAETEAPSVAGDVVPRAAVEAGRAGVHVRWANEVMTATLEELGSADEQMVIPGDPAEEICRVAADGFDAIVLGSSCSSRLRRVTSGSVADDVQALAPCPVLILGEAVGV